MKNQKKYFKTYGVILSVVMFIFIFLAQGNNETDTITDITITPQVKQGDGEYSEVKERKGEEKEKCRSISNYEEEYYRTNGNKHRFLSQEELNQTWKEVLSRPSENDIGDMPVNSWICIGPYGMRRSSSSELYSGRVKGIEVEGVTSTRVASASGGLWKFGFVFPIPISESVNSLVIGAFASKPGDENTIIIGTGEPPTGSGGIGTGLWKTLNGGLTWTNKTLSPTPAWFYKICYEPGNNSKVHSVSNTGYYRSDNGGDSWTRKFSGTVTDIAINNNNPYISYIAVYGDGIYKSINGGDDFYKITNFPVSLSEFGRASISIYKASPGYIYVGVSNQVGQTKGIYKSVNHGISWQDVSFEIPGDYYWGQGDYNNCIAVSPTDQNLVLLGAGSLLRTTNGGTNWIQFMPFTPGVENLHPDQHVIKWHSDGIRVWLGNDGGVAYSEDYGLSWNVSANFLPITQFYDFDVGTSGSSITLAGGTQDNAFPVSTNCTINNSGTWNWRLGGDAGPSKVDKYNSQRIIGICGCEAFSIQKSIDGGISWVLANTGLNTSLSFSNIEDDGRSPVICYVGNGNKIFSTTNFGDSWTQFSQYTFPSTVWRINVSKFGTGGNIIYAVINNGTDYLKVYDGGNWYSRNSGLPAPLQYVAQHPISNAIAYAITFDRSSPQKIFKTINRGISWMNRTGDMPDISVSDLIVHPTNDNILFAGTKFGMWKTTNEGVNWFRWTNGMPIANQVVRLKKIDSTSINGRFYIVAASHGRGMWIREGSGDDPNGIQNISGEIAKKYELFQNYPNPFNPTTKIQFSIPVGTGRDLFVQMKIFDLLGREVSTLVNEQLKPGTYEVDFNGSKYSSGVYFYKLNVVLSGVEAFSETKKMVLVK